MTSLSSLRINAERFWESVAASACIGTFGDGLDRLALTDADREMRDLFVSWCRDAGLTVSIDRMGNIFARRPGNHNDLPPVLFGSHLDSQQQGGRFDGVIGVLGALEVIRTLNDAGITTLRPIEIVNWTNEEGSRFTPPLIGSGVFAGVHDLAWAHAITGADGATIGGELERIGYLGSTPMGGREIDSYLELHIEQGPALDAARVHVGIVTHAYTVRGFRFGFHGETAHTGTWPMEKRRNALVAAAMAAVDVDATGWRHASEGGMATVSRIVAGPNKAGILSSYSELTCDVRHEDTAQADVMAESVLTAAQSAAQRSHCDLEIVERWDWGGRLFDDSLVEQVREVTRRLEYSHIDLASRAGHDAYHMARVAPTAMIFTPCREGITHNPKEFTTLEETTPGVNVLLHVVVERANRA